MVEFDTRTELLKAIAEFRSEVAACPDNLALKAKLALLFYRAGMMQAAKEMAGFVEERASEQDSGLLSQMKEFKGRIAFAEGDNANALKFFQQAAKVGGAFDELSRRIAWVHVRQGDYEAALAAWGDEHASAIVQELATTGAYNTRTESPTIVIPFERVDPIPCLEISVEGVSARFLLDTGGPDLSVTASFAQRIKLQSLEEKCGCYAELKDARIGYAIAADVRMGSHRISNVPSTILYDLDLSELQGNSDPIAGIIGIGLLKCFLTTIDYRGGRLILTRGKVPEDRKAHLARVTSESDEVAKVPFYMPYSHYMLAKGSLGDHEGLVYFIDSGLVALWQNSPDERIRQAAFKAPRATLMELGFIKPDERLEFPFFYPIEKLGLGSLRQSDHIGYLRGEDEPRLNPDGVFVDGLLSHAFLRQYSWTIDFEHQEFIFSR